MPRMHPGGGARIILDSNGHRPPSPTKLGVRIVDELAAPGSLRRLVSSFSLVDGTRVVLMWWGWAVGADAGNCFFLWFRKRVNRDGFFRGRPTTVHFQNHAFPHLRSEEPRDAS